MEIKKTVQVELNFITAERKRTAAVTKNVPSAADRHYQSDDVVFECNEQSQLWKISYVVPDCTDKMVCVTDECGVSKKVFNSFQLKSYIRQPNNKFYIFEPGFVPILDTLTTEIIQTYHSRFCKFEKPVEK